MKLPHLLALTTILLITGSATRAQTPVPTTVCFSPDDKGTIVNPEFCGLSFEKSMMEKNLFVPNNNAMINLFNLIGPGVFRIGANAVDKTCWNGLAGLKPITPAQVDALAGFIRATKWRVIYAVNMSVNTPENAASEASYASKALGSSLLGLEIGNEPDCYRKRNGEGCRPENYTYQIFRREWEQLAEAIRAAVPGAVLTGSADCSMSGNFSVPFAHDEERNISMLTAHYYRANGKDPKSTLPFLLEPDPKQIPKLRKIVEAATQARLPMGFRCDECGSYYNGGAPNVSDAYGTALWTLDFMFNNALNGCQGVNFHGGGRGPGYTPIADDGTRVVQVRPEFYGMKLFSLAANGAAVPVTVTLGSPVNFTAYGVRRDDGGINTVLINKETNSSVQVSLDLGKEATGCESIQLTGPSLDSTNGYTLGGEEITPEGTWAGRFRPVDSSINGKLTINVPPISAILVKTGGSHH